ncbi:MAG: hypothetical protein O7D32_06960 [bacterium]|nr:hypothetical protein [bacterium]
MNTRARHITLFIIYCVVVGQALFAFVVRPGLEGNMRAVFQELVYGEAHKPYVYRTLLPTTVRVIAEVTPEAIKEKTKGFAEGRKRMRLLRWNHAYLYEYLVASALMFGCFLWLAYVLRRLVRTFYTYPPVVSDLAPVLAFLALPLFFRYFSYIYDPATLLIFGLAIGVVYERRLVMFYLLFVLASFNKETGVLLIGWFVVREIGHRSAGNIAIHGIVMAVIFTAIKSLLVYIFRDNPGSFYEPHLLDHNLKLAFEQPLKFAGFALVTVFTVLLLREGWSSKNHFLRWTFGVTIVPLLVSGMFFGFVDELRGYYEAFSLIFLLCLPSLGRMLGVEVRETPSSRKAPSEV